MYDVCIIGSGPAGMSAGIYAARKALKVLVLEEKSIGGSVPFAPWVENYPGVGKVPGAELAGRMQKQLEGFGVGIIVGKVSGLERKGSGFVIRTPEAGYVARTVILATGCKYSRLGIPGEGEFSGKGVSYCSTCDGPFFAQKKVAVIGGGNTALSSAILMCDIASEVCLVHRRGELRGDEALRERLGGTRLLLNCIPKRIIGDKFVTGLEIEHNETKKIEVLDIQGIFVNIGTVPNSELAKGLGAGLDKAGNVVVDPNYATTIPGLFAAGDVTGGVKQIIVAAAQGAIAAIEAYELVRYGKHVSE